MRHRCNSHPEQSAVPVAVARLDGWKWIICDRGYANVIPPSDLRLDGMMNYWNTQTATNVAEQDTVYGLLYDMTPADEQRLDLYEGVGSYAAVATGKISGTMRPKEQGNGHYTKWYVTATIEKWLDGGSYAAPNEEHTTSLIASPDERFIAKTCVVLVYVDEESVANGTPKKEYIKRMNRGIEEACVLGLPTKWVESVMRKFIPHETRIE